MPPDFNDYDLNRAGPQYDPAAEPEWLNDDAPREARERYVKWAAIKQAVRGREADALRMAGIGHRGDSHINCPYSDHPDRDPSWRIMDTGKVVCTCRGVHSVFDAISALEGIDFAAAKVRVAELIGREDLIVDPNAPKDEGITVAGFCVAKKLPEDFVRSADGEAGAIFDLPPKPGKSRAMGIHYKDAQGFRRWMRIRVKRGGKKHTLTCKGHTGLPLYGSQWRPTFPAGSYCIICEGESDCLTFWFNLIPALGLPGATGWNEENHAPLFDGVPVIFVVIERDAGGEAVLKWLARSRIRDRVRLLYMPEGIKDPSALWCKNPDPAAFNAALQECMAAAQPFVAPGKDDAPAPADKQFFDSPEFSEDWLTLQFTARHKDDHRFVKSWGWQRYVKEKGVWQTENTLQVFDLARALAREFAWATYDKEEKSTSAFKLASSQTVSAIEKLARADRGHAMTPDSFDRDPYMLNTPTGAVNLRTGECVSHNRDQYFTKVVAVGYDPTAECPLFKKFLAEVTGGDVEYQKFLQRAVGYTLTGDVKEHILFFLYGTGRNGKGVLLNTLHWLLGDYAVNAAIETFVETKGDRHPTDLAVFRGMRMALAQEVADGLHWDEPKLKRLTGGDPITARLMRQDFFTYDPSHTLWFAGNHKPGLRNVDVAIRERVLLLPFTQSFAGKEDIYLSDKLRAEGPGILRWAVEGCLQWQTGLRLSPSAAVKEASAEYMHDQDKLSRWIEDCCVLQKDNFGEAAALWQSFKLWCERQNERAGTETAFGRALGDLGYKSDRFCGTRGRWGIALNREEPSSAESENDYGR